MRGSQMQVNIPRWNSWVVKIYYKVKNYYYSLGGVNSNDMFVQHFLCIVFFFFFDGPNSCNIFFVLFAVVFFAKFCWFHFVYRYPLIKDSFLQCLFRFWEQKGVLKLVSTLYDFLDSFLFLYMFMCSLRLHLYYLVLLLPTY